MKRSKMGEQQTTAIAGLKPVEVRGCFNKGFRYLPLICRRDLRVGQPNNH